MFEKDKLIKTIIFIISLLTITAIILIANALFN